MAPNPAVFLPLIRSFLPAWWSRRVGEAQLVAMAKDLRRDWESGELFAEVETTPLFLARARKLVDDLAWWSGQTPDVGGHAVERNPGAERAVLLQLVALCLARLAASEDPHGQ